MRGIRETDECGIYPDSAEIGSFTKMIEDNAYAKNNEARLELQDAS